MIQQKMYSVELISGHRIGQRGIAFLVCVTDKNINAKSIFQKLKPKQERELRTRFDYWLDGGVNNKWFHGWPNNDRYKDCFVFKWKESNRHHRLYGFLCNPLKDRPSFRLCILSGHAWKNTWETDLSELDGVIKISKDISIHDAIEKVFREGVS